MPEWLDDPTDVEVEITTDYQKTAGSGPSTLELLREQLGHLLVDHRPESFDEWDEIIPVTDDATFIAPDGLEQTEIKFDAAQAFDYCYREINRQIAAELVQISFPVFFYRKPWAYGYQDMSPFISHQNFLRKILDDIDLPDTPFRTPERDPYNDIDSLYADLAQADDLVFVDGDDYYIRECHEIIAPLPEKPNDYDLVPSGE